MTTVHPFLFRQQCIFVLEAVLLMGAAKSIFKNFEYDVITATVFIVNSVFNAFLAHSAEKSVRSRYISDRDMNETQTRLEFILSTLMPEQVVETLRESHANEGPRAHPYNCATVAQSDLCGFTKPPRPPVQL